MPTEMTLPSRRPARPAKTQTARGRPALRTLPEEVVTAHRPSVLERLRGPRSVGYFLIALGIALVIQGLHALEHVAQTMQVFVFGVPRAQAGGLLGAWFDFPIVHFTYNFVYFLLLVWFVSWAFGLGGFRRFDRLGMWLLIIAAGIQTYHA